MVAIPVKFMHRLNYFTEYRFCGRKSTKFSLLSPDVLQHSAVEMILSSLLRNLKHDTILWLFFHSPLIVSHMLPAYLSTDVSLYVSPAAMSGMEGGRMVALLCALRARPGHASGQLSAAESL